MGSVTIPAAQLSNIARAIGGGGNTRTNAYEKEMLAQSKMGQAIEQMNLDRQKAAEIEQQMGQRTPEAVQRNAMTEFGAPTDAAGDVAQFLKTRTLPGKYELPPDLAGPTEPKPAWMDNMGAMARKIASVQDSLTLGDKNSSNALKNYAASSIMQGQMAPETVGKAMAAVDAKPYVHAIGDTGEGYDLFGNGKTLNQGLRDVYGEKASALVGKEKDQGLAARAAAAHSWASADKARQDVSTGRIPLGYRPNADGSLSAIPGGPADLKIAGQYNADTSTLQSSQADLDRLATSANELLKHPGLASITGKMGAFPNIPGGEAADAQAKLNTLKSQVGFGVLQAMRNASKTGGALGNVSDAEGKRLEANLAALENAQSEKQFKESLGKVISFASGAKDRLANAYNLRYGNNAQPKQPTLTKPSAPKTVSVDY